jgi:hypothetical protein
LLVTLVGSTGFVLPHAAATREVRVSLPLVGQICRPSTSPSVLGCNLRVNGPAGVPLPLVGTPQGYRPRDIQSIYRIPRSGHPQRVAVVGAGAVNNVEDELSVWRATFGLAPCTVASHCLRLYTIGAPDPASAALDLATKAYLVDDSLETALDVERDVPGVPDRPRQHRRQREHLAVGRGRVCDARASRPRRVLLLQRRRRQRGERSG